MYLILKQSQFSQAIEPTVSLTSGHGSFCSRSSSILGFFEVQSSTVLLGKERKAGERAETPVREWLEEGRPSLQTSY
jgi:hypothetical protein